VSPSSHLGTLIDSNTIPILFIASRGRGRVKAALFALTRLALISGLIDRSKPSHVPVEAFESWYFTPRSATGGVD